MKFEKPKTIIEPFKIKMVEPLPLLSFEEREAALKESHYNLFNLPSQKVSFDLLTDSGTGSMSAAQWSAMMVGDESYAGSVSYQKFNQVIGDLTGMNHIIPTHQGRSAEALLMKAMVSPGKIVIANTHFDTTRANVETSGATALDLPDPSNETSSSQDPFKGNMDTKKLREVLSQKAQDVSFIVLTVTNNSVGGQPVSMENIKEVSAIAKEYNRPLFLDCARFAENAFFIKQREPGYSDTSVKDIAQAMFSYADGAWMSSKKDALVNIGGFLALNDNQLAQQIRSLMVITEGFPTYGGLAGRDLEALSVGIQEVLSEDYLAYRAKSVEYFGDGLSQVGFSIVTPHGGHAVYLDAGKSLPHIPWSQFPGQSLSVALYLCSGIRSVEIGTVMLGGKNEKGEDTPAPKELVRLAIPRRVYTQSHVDYMIEALAQLPQLFERLKGYKFTYEPPVLRHFTAHFAPLEL